jgi:hypothetical protein
LKNFAPTFSIGAGTSSSSANDCSACDWFDIQAIVCLVQRPRLQDIAFIAVFDPGRARPDFPLENHRKVQPGTGLDSDFCQAIADKDVQYARRRRSDGAAGILKVAAGVIS